MMFQPRVKLEFIRRYVPPAKGWSVYVDIDASEEGRTGGTRTRNQLLMQKDAIPVRAALKQLGATVGGPRAKWFSTLAYPRVGGDRDIVAFHPRRRQCVIAEIEGSSSRQSEQKLYKAMGQLVMAASVDPILDWKTFFILVVHGEAIARHLSRATALARLNISGLSLAIDPSDDQWPFGHALR